MEIVGSIVTANSEHSLAGEKLSLLAIFAHPEDESFGPAGTLAMYANEGIQVSLVTATRGLDRPDKHPMVHGMPVALGSRDCLCSCRASGIHRVCLFDQLPGQLDQMDPLLIEERLVRLIRETQPHVIVTFGPHGLTGDRDHQIINQAATLAFRDAGDPNRFESHLREGLGAWSPYKLYYCVLPSTVVSRWQVQGLCSVPDDQVTTVLDVSAYREAMRNALYCQRSQALDFIRWLTEDEQVQWDREYYSLAESRLNRKTRKEKDLFAGLR